jgi:hypothetical protein
MRMRRFGDDQKYTARGRLRPRVIQSQVTGRLAIVRSCRRIKQQIPFEAGLAQTLSENSTPTLEGPRLGEDGGTKDSRQPSRETKINPKDGMSCGENDAGVWSAKDRDLMVLSNAYQCTRTPPPPSRPSWMKPFVVVKYCSKFSSSTSSTSTRSCLYGLTSALSTGKRCTERTCVIFASCSCCLRLRV